MISIICAAMGCASGTADTYGISTVCLWLLTGYSVGQIAEDMVFASTPRLGGYLTGNCPNDLDSCYIC